MTRHVVVTGASEGIGRSLVEMFGAQGDLVTGVDVNAARAMQTQQALALRGQQMRFIHADLGQTDDLDRLAEELRTGPAIDVLIHNAGINCVGPFATSDIAAQQKVLDVNLRAPLYLTNALLHANRIARGGSLVFISSLSRFVSYPGAAVYGAAKDGLASYARSLAVGLAVEDIHVLTVYPGPTRTAHARRYSPDNRREAQRMAPEKLAAAIYHAVAQRRRVLIPGFSNGLFAMAGLWLPGLTEWAMRKSLFEKLVKLNA